MLADQTAMLTYDDIVQGLMTRLTGIPNSSIRAAGFGRVVIDSQQVTAGDIFIALTGEKNDGADYIPQAIDRGASGVITERIPASVPPNNTTALFVVDNSLKALQSLAQYWRSKHNVIAIGVTGSIGKTSVKELLASVMAQKYRVLKNEGNLNNEIGLPLTLLKLRKEHQIVVLEMGTYGLGEIATLCEIARPEIGVVTNVGPCHLERMGSLETIAQAKAELVESLPPSGTAVLNGDDERVQAMSARTKARVLFYGVEPQNDFWASEIESRGLDGIRFRLNHGQESFLIKSPLPGVHSVHTVLAAAAVALNQGLGFGDIIAGLHDHDMQLRLLVLPGVNGSTIIDDSYNASPDSMIAALNLLSEMEGRKIAVLGDMLELGDLEVEAHERVGQRAAAVADKLIVVGQRAKIIGEESVSCGLRDVAFVNSNEEAVEILKGNLIRGDYVLVKGSRAMSMEQITERISE